MGHNEDHLGEGLFSIDYAHCQICEKVEEHQKDDTVETTPGDLMFVKNKLLALHAPKWMRAGLKTEEAG